MVGPRNTPKTLKGGGRGGDWGRMGGEVTGGGWEGRRFLELGRFFLRVESALL